MCIKIALKQQQKTGKLHKKPLSRNSTPQIPILLKKLLKYVCFKNLCCQNSSLTAMNAKF